MVKEASRASDGGAAPPGEANAPWHARPAEEALAEHGTDAERGLPPERVEALRARFGENALPEPPRPSALRRFLAQFRDPLVGTLLVAAVVAATVAITEPSDAPWLVRLGDTFAITLIVLLNALLGFWQERRAEAALDALGAMVGTAARVVRGGATQDV